MGLKRTIEHESEPVLRMLDAAEVLFAKHGLEDTSVRQITQYAGVNLASVNYHFGSKDDLAEAVFERVIRRVTGERQQNLFALINESEAMGRPLDLAEVVSCFIEPYLGDGNEAQGALMARFILLHRLTPNSATRRIVEQYLNPLAADYAKAFRQVCPEVEVAQMLWRYLLMVSTIVLTATEDRQADRLAVISGGDLTIADRSAMRDALVRFVVAGISGKGKDVFTPPAVSVGRARAKMPEKT